MGTALTFDQIHDFSGSVERMSFRATIEAFFSFSKLSNWLAKKASKLVQQLHDPLSKLYSEILNDPTILQGLTLREYQEFSELVRGLTKLKAIYSKAEFYESARLENLLDATLQLSYAVEAEIRIAVYAGKKHAKTDDELKEGLSMTSQRAIIAKLDQ
jgi:hypothetical protein